LIGIRGGADGQRAPCHVCDASWVQWPPLEAAIKNNIVADFPSATSCSIAPIRDTISDDDAHAFAQIIVCGAGDNQRLGRRH